MPTSSHSSDARERSTGTAHRNGAELATAMGMARENVDQLIQFLLETALLEA